MRRRPLAVLFLTVFLDLVGFGIVIPLLPFYAEHFGATPWMVGVLIASYSLAQLLFAPLWGRLSDRVGRRPVILASVAGSAVSLTAFALADSFGMLLAARFFAGAAGANVAAAQAYVADVTPGGDRARGMGAIGAAFGLGFILGPAVGGFFGRWGFAAPAFVAAGLSVANFVLAWFLLPEPERRRAGRGARWAVLDVGAFRRLAERPALLGLLALGFVMTLAFTMLESTFGLWSERAHGFGQTETGYFFAYLGVVLAVAQGGLVGPLTRRFGERRVLLAGLAGMAAGLALLPFALSLALLFGVMGLVALANGLANPSSLALLSLEAAAEEQGATLGLAQSLSALARVVGPLWGGFSFGAFGIAWPFWFGAAGMVAAFALAAAVGARLKATSAGAAESGNTS